MSDTSLASLAEALKEATAFREKFLPAANRINYKDWTLIFEEDYIQWKWYGINAATGDDEWFTSRKWRISKHMTISEFVQTCFAAALQAEEHECREHFHYGTFRPFHPHIDLGALCMASENVVTREEPVDADT